MKEPGYEFDSIEFPNDAAGQTQKVKTIQQMARAGWEVASETVQSMQYSPCKALVGWIVCFPYMLFSAKSGEIIVVFKRPLGPRVKPSVVEVPRAKTWRFDTATQAFKVWGVDKALPDVQTISSQDRVPIFIYSGLNGEVFRVHGGKAEGWIVGEPLELGDKVFRREAFLPNVSQTAPAVMKTEVRTKTPLERLKRDRVRAGGIALLGVALTVANTFFPEGGGLLSIVGFAGAMTLVGGLVWLALSQLRIWGRER